MAQIFKNPREIIEIKPKLRYMFPETDMFVYCIMEKNKILNNKLIEANLLRK